MCIFPLMSFTSVTTPVLPSHYLHAFCNSGYWALPLEASGSLALAVSF